MAINKRRPNFGPTAVYKYCEVTLQGTVGPVQAMKLYGEFDIYIYTYTYFEAFIASALDGSKWFGPYFGRFPAGESTLFTP
jgi:hypothetical protein